MPLTVWLYITYIILIVLRFPSPLFYCEQKFRYCWVMTLHQTHNKNLLITVPHIKKTKKKKSASERAREKPRWTCITMLLMELLFVVCLPKAYMTCLIPPPSPYIFVFFTCVFVSVSVAWVFVLLWFIYFSGSLCKKKNNKSLLLKLWCLILTKSCLCRILLFFSCYWFSCVESNTWFFCLSLSLSYIFGGKNKIFFVSFRWFSCFHDSMISCSVTT